MNAKIAKDGEMKQYNGFVFVLLWEDISFRQEMNPDIFYNSDPWLQPYTGTIDRRIQKCLLKEQMLTGNGAIGEFAMGHYYYGLHRTSENWIFREWAPNAKSIYLTGTFTGWKEQEQFMMKRIEPKGDWEFRHIPKGLCRTIKPKYLLPRSGHPLKSINGILKIFPPLQPHR
jgi:hypothetical protein